MYQNQYLDTETRLYYNRFRYYDSNIGNYISQDPIGLAGNNPTLYGYVKNANKQFDLFGLSILDDPDWLSKVSAPNKNRHDPTKVTTKSLPKEKNTMIDSTVDVDADVEAIRNGKATRNGDQFSVNNRTYGVHADTGKLYPVSGDGFTTLDRGGYKALGVYNVFGNTDKANDILDKMKINPDQRQKALGVWEKNH